MLQIKNLISDENVVQVIFTAETKSDAKTIIALISCYATDFYRCMLYFDDVKIPLNKEVIWTFDDRDKSSYINVELKY